MKESKHKGVTQNPNLEEVGGFPRIDSGFSVSPLNGQNIVEIMKLQDEIKRPCACI